MSKSCLILLIALCFSLVGCATIYNPATEREEVIFVTTPMEVAIGNMLSSKLASQYEFSKDTNQINRVNEIGERVSKVSDRRDLKYKFNVIKDEALNAFTVPGGSVYVHSGLVEKASDDELACVLGHEIGHVAARHIAKKMQSQIGYDILMNIAVRGGGLRELQSAASISYDLIMKGYSREDELMADRLGVKYAYKSGYDPNAMISFLEKLEAANKGDVGFLFLRTHPYVSQRIKMMRMHIPSIIEKAGTDKDEQQAIIKDKIEIKESPVGINKNPQGNVIRPLKVMCPVCKKVFPGKTAYCPYDGAQLK